MEYNIENIRAIAERWLAGETSLSEEAALREFFARSHNELPVDLRPYRLLFGQSAGSADERSHRKLILHTEPAGRTAVAAPRSGHRPLRRWMAAASAVAAAVIVAMVAIFSPVPASPDSIVCVVNGVRITDPDQISAYTREAFRIADDNLRKPGEALSSELSSDPAMTRVGEMLNELSKDR